MSDLLRYRKLTLERGLDHIQALDAFVDKYETVDKLSVKLRDSVQLIVQEAEAFSYDLTNQLKKLEHGLKLEG